MKLNPKTFLSLSNSEMQELLDCLSQIIIVNLTAIVAQERKVLLPNQKL